LVPIEQDHTQIPARSLERVRAIYDAGIRPKAFIIAHEAPKQLPAPKAAPQITPLEFWSRRLAEHSLTALKLTGVVLTAVVVPLLVAALGVAALIGMGILSVALTDPCLIVVTEDDVWIQIDYWMV